MARKTIVALYDSAQDAEAARKYLLDVEIPDDDIEIVAHSGFGAGSGHGEIVPRMTGWGVPFDEAQVYAEGVSQGGTLLVVSVLKEQSVDRAVAIINHGPVTPAHHDGIPHTEAVKPVPNAMSAGPSSPDASDAVVARRAAKTVDTDSSLSSAASAMRDANASGNRAPRRTAAKGTGAKPEVVKPAPTKPDTYVDRPDGGGRRP